MQSFEKLFKSNYLIILHHGFTTLGVQFLKKRNTFS